MSRRIILGKSPSRSGAASGGYGLYVAKPGFDADTAADVNMVFSSDWPAALNVIQKGTVGVSPNSTATVSFAAQPVIPFGDFAYSFSSQFTYNGAYGQFTYPQNKYCAYFSPAIYYNGAYNIQYLRILTYSSYFTAFYNLYGSGYGITGMPEYFTIAYCIYERG